MSLLTNALSAVAPSVTNEQLGTVAKAFDAAALGEALRPLLSGVVVTAGVAASNKAEELPSDPAIRSSLIQTVYDAFSGGFSRRSLGALARSTGLLESAVLTLLEGNEDFRVSQGQSGTTFVSLRAV